MESRGKLLGPNFIARLLRILPWAESQIGTETSPPARTPQLMQPQVHLGKLYEALEYDDATGVTVTIWTGKPAAATTKTIDNVVISELLMTSGQLASGSAVRIQQINGKWFVVGAPC